MKNPRSSGIKTAETKMAEASKHIHCIVACQGTTQLIAALSSLKQQRVTAARPATYRATLVIHGLFLSAEDEPAFADYIERLARSVEPWERVVYLSTTDVDRWLVFGQTRQGQAQAFDEIYERVGLDHSDEIYLSGNWLRGNQLLISAFRGAKKICYGDGIGLEIAEHYARPRTTAWSIRYHLSALRRLLGLPALKRSGLQRVNFDIGCFVLPEPAGGISEMPRSLVDRKVVYELIEKMASRAQTEDHLSPFRTDQDVSKVILLSENFSESKTMSLENEIAAYGDFMDAHGIASHATLIIKPHPRDSLDKLTKLREAMEGRFSKVCLLDASIYRFTPFEIFWLQDTQATKGICPPNLALLAFGATSLSLSHLFGVKPLMGFGEAIVQTRFFPEHCWRRLKWESDLRSMAESHLKTRPQPAPPPNPQFF